MNNPSLSEQLIILGYHIMVFGILLMIGAVAEKVISFFTKKRYDRAAEIALKRKAEQEAEQREIGRKIRFEMSPPLQTAKQFTAEHAKTSPIRKVGGVFSDTAAQALWK